MVIENQEDEEKEGEGEREGRVGRGVRRRGRRRRGKREGEEKENGVKINDFISPKRTKKRRENYTQGRQNE